MARLSNKCIVLTGAGSGIGQGMAEGFVREGAQVLGVDLSEAGLAETAARVSGPGRFETLVGNVTDKGLPDAIRTKLSALGWQWNVLCNNAGIGGGGMAGDTDDETLNRYLDVNVTGLFRLSRAAVNDWKGKAGVILNTASIYSFIGATGSAAYSTSKAAVAGLTRQMATDYGVEGIRVVAVAPGLIETALTAERIRTEAWRRHIYIDQSPLRRVGKPEDIANGAIFLISDEASFITGETLRIDGGWTLGRYPRPDED
ncbi:short-chain dehydrogenase [Pararhodobacter marinus]|uniref:Short-chain dehydrogenase n=1 Tax=Pararhodobacter marinus TaxID=2184063 RepID=A0A2U2CBF3_9RHOB|nr:SDR family oxidoreductase [Pararhodobacter marinus]PWE29226.1 short-chain dehydrogenase [Pararhodobacter marinus]